MGQPLTGVHYQGVPPIFLKLNYFNFIQFFFFFFLAPLDRRVLDESYSEHLSPCCGNFDSNGPGWPQVNWPNPQLWIQSCSRGLEVNKCLHQSRGAHQRVGCGDAKELPGADQLPLQQRGRTGEIRADGEA